MHVSTLKKEDFFIHLCTHLHKEATTLPWVKMNRDMTLYKYCDIYMLLSGMTELEVDRIFNRATQLGASDICSFAILQTANLFLKAEAYAVIKATSAIGGKNEILHYVISPENHKYYSYIDKNIFNKFFSHDRETLLKEVTDEETENDK